MFHATHCSPPNKVNTPSTANGSRCREIKPRDLAAKKASRLACLTSLVNVSRDRLQCGYVWACRASLNNRIKIMPTYNFTK
jgi:hypothetical protein